MAKNIYDAKDDPGYENQGNYYLPYSKLPKRANKPIGI